ncbi:MAG: SDR family oxidoreductase [Planctomycetaceae bacterium]
MKRLIIGCGYLGRRVAKKWLEAGDDVSALTRSHERAGELRAEGIDPLVGDVMDSSSLACLNDDNRRPFDTLLYAVARDRGAAVTMHDLYLYGLRNVLSRLAPMPRRLIYISSTSVYGQDDGEWVDESSPCEPAQENGRTCLDGEKLLWDHLGAHPESQGVILRLAGIYGPGRLVVRAAAIQAGEPIRGNPAAWLNLIHVDDAVRAVVAADERGTAGETYLVVDDEPLRRRDYYGALARFLSAPEPTFEPLPNSAVLAKTATSGTNKRCSNRKLRDVLQVELAYPTISTGLPDALHQA